MFPLQKNNRIIIQIQLPHPLLQLLLQEEQPVAVKSLIVNPPMFWLWCIVCGKACQGFRKKRKKYNDSKFHKVLIGLVCALLQLKPEEIESIIIMNPIDLAGEITGKRVSLNQIELANEEDRASGLDYWAELFKVKTRELLNFSRC